MSKFDCDWLKVGAIAFAVVGMIAGTYLVYLRLKAMNQGFGPSSLQALAIVFFLPTLVVIAVISQINAEALAALLGTIAGYVLASPKRDEKKP